jgi:hypothetical protein
VDRPAGKSDGPRRLTAARLGESPADRLERAEHRLTAADEVIVQPHRRTLSKTRLEDLVRTVRQHGMTGESLGAAVAYRPSIGYVLIGGEHRWAALSAPGSRTQVIVLRNWDDLVAWMAIDVTDPRRLGWDAISAVSFYEKAIGALKPGRGDKPMEDVAEFVGIHRGVLETVRWANAIIADEDADSIEREYLREALAVLEATGEGGHGLRAAFRRFQQAQAAASIDGGKQEATLRRALIQLNAAAQAVAAMGPISPSFDTAAAAEIRAAITRALSPMNIVKIQLQERAKQS